MLIPSPRKRDLHDHTDRTARGQFKEDLGDRRWRVSRGEMGSEAMVTQFRVGFGRPVRGQV